MTAEPKLRILVADDNRMVLATVCRMLNALGYDAQEAADGREALRRFEQAQFDLVLTDIQMPYMDGWELTRRVKSLVPGMHVIAMTGMSPAEVPGSLGETDPDYVLFKPLRVDELENAMAIAFVPRQLKIAGRGRREHQLHPAADKIGSCGKMPDFQFIQPSQQVKGRLK